MVMLQSFKIHIFMFCIFCSSWFFRLKKQLSKKLDCKTKNEKNLEKTKGFLCPSFPNLTGECNCGCSFRFQIDASSCTRFNLFVPSCAIVPHLPTRW